MNTVKLTVDQLATEFKAAIFAVTGATDGDEIIEVSAGDLIAIAKKVGFYLEDKTNDSN